MLQAASNLFARKGYALTTFDEIAAAAGVSVATVYNHFENKDGIVAALLRPDVEQILARAERVIEHPPPDPAVAMVRMLSAYRNLGGRNWKSRELLRLTIVPTIGNTGQLTELVQDAERRTQSQIRSLLQKMQASGQLVPHLPLADATAVIFALLNQHFAAYLTSPALTFEAMFRALSRRVQLVFDTWRAAPARARRGINCAAAAAGPSRRSARSRPAGALPRRS